MVGNANERGTVTPESLRAEGLNPEQVLQHLGLKRLGTVRSQLLALKEAGSDMVTLTKNPVSFWSISISDLFEQIEPLGSSITAELFLRMWLNKEFKTFKFKLDLASLDKQRVIVQQMQQVAEGSILVVQDSRETYAGANANRYEFTYTQLLTQVGLKNVGEVLNWLLSQGGVHLEKQIFIQQWGITLEELISVFDILKPKVEPRQSIARHLPSDVLIQLAGSEFLESWFTNEFGTRRVVVNSGDIGDAIELIKAYKQINQLKRR